MAWGQVPGSWKPACKAIPAADFAGSLAATEFQAADVTRGHQLIRHYNEVRPSWVISPWVPGLVDRAVSSGDPLGGGRGILWVSPKLQWLQVARNHDLTGTKDSGQRLGQAPRTKCALIRDSQAATIRFFGGRPGVHLYQLSEVSPEKETAAFLS